MSAGSVVAEGESSPSASRSLGGRTWALTAVVVLTQVFGNLFLTWGMKREQPVLGLSPVAYVETILTPYVFLGITLLILWMLARMALLSWADLSFVLPMTSIGYVLTAFVGKYFFGEHISWARWSGTLLIFAGTTLVGMTTPNTTGTGAKETE